MIQTDLALIKMSEGYNCAQSIVAAFARDVGLDLSTALKVAGGFGGGLAHHGHVCGAVSGALMIIGMKYSGIEAEYASREHGYAMGTVFIEEFESRNRTIECRSLLDCDLSTPEGLERFKQEGIFQSTCPRWVKDAADILGTLL